MSGISMIQNNINSRTTRTLNTESSGKEIWLKDGDQVFMKSIASGDEGDIFLDELKEHLTSFLYTKKKTSTPYGQDGKESCVSIKETEGCVKNA